MNNYTCEGCGGRADTSYALQMHQKGCPNYQRQTQSKYDRQNSLNYTPQEKQVPLRTQTMMGREFGILNGHYQNNCFLNAALQLLWAIPSVRVNFCSLSMNSNGNENKYKALIESIMNFFAKVVQNNSTEKVLEHDPNEIRRELFKIGYQQDTFELFGRADTAETINQVLEALHEYLPCTPNNKCFVHQKFFLNRETQLICSCNKTGPVVKLDKDLFIEYQFNTNELIRALKQNNQQSNDVYTYGKIQGELFKAQQTLFNDQTNESCVNSGNGVNRGHKTKTLHWLRDEYPEAFLANLNYDHVDQNQASAKDILALMLSIPEAFKPTKDLYGNHNQHRKSDTELIFRGLVAFSGDHYVCYTRAIQTKIGFVTTDSKDYDRIESEVTEATEWTLFNDNQVQSISGNWKQIVEDCVSARHQPTVVLYERFSQADKECGVQAKPPAAHLWQFSHNEIQQLMIIAQSADEEAGVYDEDEIEQQRQLMAQFQQNVTEQPETEVQPVIEENKQNQEISMTQTTTKQNKTIRQIRKEYDGSNIYFYKCMSTLKANDCQGYQVLHREKCPFCDIENEYFDQSLKSKVTKQNDQNLLAELNLLVNPNRDVIEQDFEVERPKTNIVPVQTRILDETNPEETEATRINSESNSATSAALKQQAISVWKCWECNNFYEMEEQCQRCELTISHYTGDDLMSIVTEIDPRDKLQQQPQMKEDIPQGLKPGELHPFDETCQFSCDACTLINNYDMNDARTAECESCGERKYTIYDKIKSHINSQKMHSAMDQRIQQIQEYMCDTCRAPASGKFNSCEVYRCAGRIVRVSGAQNNSYQNTSQQKGNNYGASQYSQQKQPRAPYEKFCDNVKCKMIVDRSKAFCSDCRRMPTRPTY